MYTVSPHHRTWSGVVHSFLGSFDQLDSTGRVFVFIHQDLTEYLST